MTLEKYNIAEVENNNQIELSSPMEQAMSKLQRLIAMKCIPKDMYLEIKTIIGLLGKSADVFRVHVTDHKVQLDEEMTRYLFDLVHDVDVKEDSKASSSSSPYRPPPKIAIPESDDETTMHVDSPNLNAAPQTLVRYKTEHSTCGNSGASNNDTKVTCDRRRMILPLSPNATAAAAASPLFAKEDSQINEILRDMDAFNFDVFEVDALTNGRPLFFVGTALFKKYNLISKFRIDRNKLTNFLNMVEMGYPKNNPYHNSTHAADVARTVHYFTHNFMHKYTTDVEVLALIVASLIHDYDHPGRTNQFHIATRDPKAILYNDRSVLENHHVAQGFFLINKDENNIFGNMNTKDYALVRKNIVELVIATDMGNHFDFMAQFKSSVASGALTSTGDKLVGVASSADRLMVHKMALKCSDLGHTFKLLDLHKKWTVRITEEFLTQGDDERRRGLQLSPFMDRTTAKLPQSQVGFFDFLVSPMLTIWSKFLDLEEPSCPLLPQFKINYDHWKSQL